MKDLLIFRFDFELKIWRISAFYLLFVFNETAGADHTDGNDDNDLTKDTNDNKICDNFNNDDHCGANVDYDRG